MPLSEHERKGLERELAKSQRLQANFKAEREEALASFKRMQGVLPAIPPVISALSDARERMVGAWLTPAPGITGLTDAIAKQSSALANFGEKIGMTGAFTDIARSSRPCIPVIPPSHDAQTAKHTAEMTVLVERLVQEVGDANERDRQRDKQERRDRWKNRAYGAAGGVGLTTFGVVLSKLLG